MTTIDKPTAHFNDVTLRDGHQSLIAGRMRQEDLEDIAKPLATAGYDMLEVWGGTRSDIPTRFLGEDHWQNLKQISEVIHTEAAKAGKPAPKLSMLLRGQNLVGYRHYADDEVRAFVREAAAHGINNFRIFDALNDTRNLETAISEVKALQTEGRDVTAQGTICYTESPVHTIEGFVEVGKKLKALGCDSICVKDMAGMLTPEATTKLLRALKAEVGLPLTVHTHTSMGRAEGTLEAAVKEGATIDVASPGMSGGAGQVSSDIMAQRAEQLGFDAKLDQNAVNEAADRARNLRLKYGKWESKFNPKYDQLLLAAKLPGGMRTTFEGQIRQILGQRGPVDEQVFDALFRTTLEEIVRVSENLGHLTIVTPTSQIVGEQAVINVLNNYSMLKNSGQPCDADALMTYMREAPLEQRYLGKLQTKTTELLLGRYGALPSPARPELIERAIQETGKQPITHRPADDLEPGMPKNLAKIDEMAESHPSILPIKNAIADALTVGLFDEGNIGGSLILKRSGFIKETPKQEPLPTLPPEYAALSVPMRTALENLAQNSLQQARIQAGLTDASPDIRQLYLKSAMQAREHFKQTVASTYSDNGGFPNLEETQTINNALAKRFETLGLTPTRLDLIQGNAPRQPYRGGETRREGNSWHQTVKDGGTRVGSMSQAAWGK